MIIKKKKIISLLLAAAMVMTSTGVTAFAAGGASSSWSFKAPTAPMATTSTTGKRNVKMNAFRASVNIPAILGADLVAGGNITWQSQDTSGNKIGFNLIGSDVNVNPDTYAWNFNYVSTKFGYQNQVRTFQWLKSDGTAASNQEVWEVLPQSEFMYPILDYSSNATNMYASWGGNDTDKSILEELGGLSKTMYMRPDVVLGNNGSFYVDQVNAIRGFSKDSPYYQEGDEDYDPLFIEIGVGTIKQKIDGIKTTAQAMNRVINESEGTLTGRYGDPYEIATDLEKTIYGTYYYIMSNLEEYGGKIKKKNVAWVSGYSATDSTYTVTTTFGPTFQMLGKGTTNKVFGPVTEVGQPGETKTFKVTADDLSKFDFLYVGSDSVRKQLFNDFATLNLTADQVPDVMTSITFGLCNDSNEWASSFLEQNMPIIQIYAYREELAKIDASINPVAMLAYITENWYHVNSRSVRNVVAKMLDGKWNSVDSELDDVPEKVDYEYDPDKIETMIVKGMDFAASHKNDESTWLEGSFNINDPIYKKLVKGDDSAYSDDRVPITDAIKTKYLEGVKDQPWTPDRTLGIGKNGTGGVAEELVGDKIEKEMTNSEYAATRFNDVPENSWFASSVGYAAKNGLFYGVSEKTFAPDKAMDRAMLVSVLYRMAGSPEVTTSGSFTDVKEDAYYAKAVEWAKENNVTSGTSATTFSPTSELTREQLVTLLYRYFKATGKDVSGSADLSKFTDASEIADFAQTAFKWAVNDGVIFGVTDTKIAPKGIASRAMVAAMLERLEA